MAKYKVKAFYFGNGNKIHKGGEVLDEKEIVGGEIKINQAIKEGFIVPENSPDRNQHQKK